MDILTAASRGNLPQLQARLAEDAKRLNMRFSKIRSNPQKPSEMDWMTPLVGAVANGQIDAVRLLLDRGADIAIHDGKGNSIESLADAQGAEIKALIRQRMEADTH